MKTLLMLLAATACADQPQIRIDSWKMQGEHITLTWNAHSGGSYTVVRFNPAAKYYDGVTNVVAATNGPLSVTFNPKSPSDEDQPEFSGVCWFYVSALIK